MESCHGSVCVCVLQVHSCDEARAHVSQRRHEGDAKERRRHAAGRGQAFHHTL